MIQDVAIRRHDTTRPKKTMRINFLPWRVEEEDDGAIERDQKSLF